MANKKIHAAAKRNRERYKLQGRRDANKSRRVIKKIRDLKKKFQQWDNRKIVVVALGGNKAVSEKEVQMWINKAN